MDWSELFNDEVEHKWSVLKEQILEAEEQFIPPIKKKAKVPWLSKQVKIAVRTKQNAFRKFKTTNLSVTYIQYDHYKVSRNKAKDMMCQARLNYESQLIADIETKPCRFIVILEVRRS